MTEIADRLRGEGRRPFVIPIGASTPLGALGYVDALLELLDQIPAPDAIVHSTSSGGTQAGLRAPRPPPRLPPPGIGGRARRPLLAPPIAHPPGAPRLARMVARAPAPGPAAPARPRRVAWRA